RRRARFRRRRGVFTGGGRGIRTPGTLPGTVVFKTTAIDHSAIPPPRHSGRNLLSTQGLHDEPAAMCHRKCSDPDATRRRVPENASSSRQITVLELWFASECLLGLGGTLTRVADACKVKLSVLGAARSRERAAPSSSAVCAVCRGVRGATGVRDWQQQDS